MTEKENTGTSLQRTAKKDCRQWAELHGKNEV